MTTQQLECFVKVAETLNYKSAANQLFISQPAVSKQIMSLENELGAKLFVRSSHSVSLSVMGKAFLENAHNILKLTYQSKQLAANQASELIDTLRIGYTEPHETYRMVEVVQLMRMKYPMFHPMFEMNQWDTNLMKLERGELDLCFSFVDFVKPFDYFMFVPIASQRMICILPKDHPKADYSTIGFEDLKSEKQVISVPFPLKNRHHSGKKEQGIPIGDNQKITVCSNASEAYALVLAGYGYCVLPQFTVIENPSLALLDWKHDSSASHGIVYSKNNKRELLTDFIKYAKEKMI